jgi:hypothetical protein
MSDVGYALHVALLARLKSLVSVPVWDAVPQGSEYPYVSMNSIMAIDDPYLTLRVSTRYAYLSIWSRAYGQAEVLQIMGEINQINETPLALSAGHVASVRVERTQTVRDTDNLTFQGQVTLRIITQED